MVWLLSSSSSFTREPLNTSPHAFLKSSCFYLITPLRMKTGIPPRLPSLTTRASVDDTRDPISNPPFLLQGELQTKQVSQGNDDVDDHFEEVDESVRVLKTAAKTRKVSAEEILAAFSVIEKAKVEPSRFLETLGGTESPGRTWMLVFTAEKRLRRGRYFPITAVQRFDAAAKRIENGVYLGPLGNVTFEGRFSWNNRILAFIFERIRVKVGPFNPFEISFKGNDEREPTNTGKYPFFVWFYIDEEIVVARGKSGGTALWVRCKRVSM
ncbi:unnamed protein product [Cuscuta epithymum]|uniref:Plastid lipid-associated protein/fibrillin conserved domain-containing protein n=1 Tax=Cuscuta epithymum TaxID=186058 RepID=A0AAV0FLN4_9ASTE|nr:unnamed protein product [Cuscuta epithymum]